MKHNAHVVAYKDDLAYRLAAEHYSAVPQRFMLGGDAPPDSAPTRVWIGPFGRMTELV